MSTTATSGTDRIKAAQASRDEKLKQLEDQRKVIYTEFCDAVRAEMRDGTTGQQAAAALDVQRAGLYELFRRYPGEGS